MSPSCCCGETPECGGCAGTVPEQMQVDFTGITDGAACDCDSLNGTFVLDYDAGLSSAGACVWTYDLGTFATLCTGTITMSIASDGTITITLGLQYPVGNVTTIIFEDADASAPLDCPAISAQDIPHLSTNQDAGSPPATVCTTSSPTATLTAL